jgi:hypothetical protein
MANFKDLVSEAVLDCTSDRGSIQDGRYIVRSSIIPPNATGTLNDYAEFIQGVEASFIAAGWSIDDAWGDVKEAFGELNLTLSRALTSAEHAKIAEANARLAQDAKDRADKDAAQLAYDNRPDIVRIRTVMATRNNHG